MSNLKKVEQQIYFSQPSRRVWANTGTCWLGIQNVIRASSASDIIGSVKNVLNVLKEIRTKTEKQIANPSVADAFWNYLSGTTEEKKKELEKIKGEFDDVIGYLEKKVAKVTIS